MKRYVCIALVGVFLLALSGCAPRPRRVEVPRVVGMHYTEAVELIESKGFATKTDEGEAATTEELEFIVYEQDPAAGIKVLKGTMVTLDYYGKHEEELNYRTDKVYKLLYVCPWYTNYTGFAGLDQIKAIGFNAYHTYSILQWEQQNYFSTPEGRADCLRQIEVLLQQLKKRDMYGCLQMPVQDRNLRDVATLMGRYDNAICITVEEPDLHIPPRPSLEEQQRYYDTIQEVAPNLQVWGCFNGGISPETCNISAFHVIVTDSYCYDAGSKPVPGTLAAQNGDVSLPWWTMNEWITEVKIPRMLDTIPKGVGIINLQQGMYATSEGHKLPNMMEEWNLYTEAFGGLNSFSVYAHGYGQGMGAVWVMEDNRDVPYSLQNQCRQIMKMLDEMGGE